MRDADKSRGTFPESIRKALTQTNSKMHSILIIVILLSLTAIAGYLVYDILSFRAAGILDGSSGMQGKGSEVAMNGWLEKGIKLFENGKYNESIECFDKAIAENSSNASAWKYKGRALNANGDYKGAIACYDKALLLNPSDGEAIYYKGTSLLAMNKSNEARDLFAKAEKLGNWPNPMHSANLSNKNSVKSSGTAASGGSKIVVNWALANSESHGSGGSGSDSYVSVPKTVATNKDVSHASSNENNLTINLTNNLSTTHQNESNTNITPMNASEINGSLKENTSIGPSIKAARSNVASTNKVKKPAKVLPAKARVNAVKSSIKPTKKQLASKSTNNGTQADSSALSGAKAAGTSASKTITGSGKPKLQPSAAKKSVKAPVKPATSKAPSARLKAAGASKKK